MDEWRHGKEQTVRVGTGDERACGEVVEVRTRDEAEELSLRQLRVNESLIIGQSLGWLIRTLGHSWRLRHLQGGNMSGPPALPASVGVVLAISRMAHE